MPTTPAATLNAHNIHLWRGERHLLKAVSFAVKAGESLQLVGPNGVGKTSLLRVCCGLLPMESGELLYDAEPVARAQDRYHSSLTYLAHTNALKAELTAEENLRFELRLRKEVGDAEIAAQLQEFGITHCAQLPARALSAGQRRRLALARVVLADTPLWILDEPTTNLDVDGIALVERCMQKHLDGGGSILAAAHHRLLADYAASKTLELSA